MAMPAEGSEPQIVSRLSDVLRTMRGLIAGAIQNYGITNPGMVLVGYPTWTEATKILSQPGGPGFVTVDALPDIRVTTRYAPMWGQVGPIVTAFSATFTPGIATFAQAVSSPTPAGTNVFVFFVAGSSNIKYSAQYTTLAGDTPSTVATAQAEAINALGVMGVTASPVGNIVNLTGASFVAVNVEGTGVAHMEVARIVRTIQVSIWIADYYARWALHEAISSNLGTSIQHSIQLPDGGWFIIQPKGESSDDKSQESTNVYIHHFTYAVEYGVIQRGVFSNIGEVNLQTIIESESGVQIQDTTSLIS